MSIYQQYLAKMAADEAAYAPAAILRYPFLGNKPKDVDEMANRREDLGTRAGLGATAGVLGALALRGLARKGVNHFRPGLGEVAHGLAPLTGAFLGAAGGGMVHSGLRMLDNVQQHHQAVQDHYAHGGAPLPFLVRHPYATAAVAPFVGLALGGAVGAGIAKSLGHSAVEGLNVGGVLSTALTQPLINKFTRDQRDAVLPTAKLRADQGDDMQSYLG